MAEARGSRFMPGRSPAVDRLVCLVDRRHPLPDPGSSTAHSSIVTRVRAADRVASDLASLVWACGRVATLAGRRDQTVDVAGQTTSRGLERA